jgi:NADH-quinone oxidoreductase subunit E
LNTCSCSHEANEVGLKKVLAKYQQQDGALIPVLQEAQQIYGYLPTEVLTAVAEALDLPLTKVYGVTTFYSQFHLKPRGRHIIRICQGTACHVRGSARLVQTVSKTLGITEGETTKDLRYTLEPVACLGACGQAPVMMVNEDSHGRLNEKRILTNLENYT